MKINEDDIKMVTTQARTTIYDITKCIGSIRSNTSPVDYLYLKISMMKNWIQKIVIDAIFSWKQMEADDSHTTIKNEKHVPNVKGYDTKKSERKKWLNGHEQPKKNGYRDDRKKSQTDLNQCVKINLIVSAPSPRTNRSNTP